MGNVDRTTGASEPVPYQPPRAVASSTGIRKPTLAGDALELRRPAAPHAGSEDPSELLEQVEDLAENVHRPHGAMHAIEAGEHVVGAASRAFRSGGRALGSAAEVVGGHHHGLLGRAEALVTRGLKVATRWTALRVARVPGGLAVVRGTQRVLGLPGRLLGPKLDALLAGTRIGRAARFTGSGGRMVTTMGGRVPLIGAALGGVIAVADVRHAWTTLRSPHVSRGGKVIAATQGILSAVSGALGVVALGGAAAIALGLSVPFAVPTLLGAAAITGMGAFALSFLVPGGH
jgi:hypothetical protein